MWGSTAASLLGLGHTSINIYQDDMYIYCWESPNPLAAAILLFNTFGCHCSFKTQVSSDTNLWYQFGSLHNVKHTPLSISSSYPCDVDPTCLLFSAVQPDSLSNKRCSVPYHRRYVSLKDKPSLLYPWIIWRVNGFWYMKFTFISCSWKGVNECVWPVRSGSLR